MQKVSIQLKDKKTNNLPVLRKKNLELFKSKVTYLDSDTIEELEEAIYQIVIEKCNRIGIPLDHMDDRFMNIYESNIRHYRINLDPTSYVGNTQLAAEIQAGTILPLEILNMTPMELHKERWESFNTEEEAELNVIMTGGDGELENDTNLYKCGKCKGNNCAYRESQTRSADEGSTHRIRCKDCGNRWNHYN